MFYWKVSIFSLHKFSYVITQARAKAIEFNFRAELFTALLDEVFFRYVNKSLKSNSLESNLAGIDHKTIFKFSVLDLN